VSFRDITDRLAVERQAAQLRALAEREEARREVSDRLQQVLVTRPPDDASLQVGVRYRPASAQAKVGGDWYDAFKQPDGTTMLVIGDVVGHDTLAIGAMAQYKGLLRGIAYGSSDSPAQTMTRFDATARGLGITALATVLLVRLQSASENSGVREVTWSNAGHLSPVVVTPGRRAESLPSSYDLLLGIDPTSRRIDHTITMTPRSTLLLYTDGLIERRDEHLDVGIERLLDVLTELADLGVDDLCDQLLQRLIIDAPDDDIALLAAR
jgi:serine phosphatase RsbU (regulator of sigma subunit)